MDQEHFINKMDNMLSDGYTKKFARYYLMLLEQEENCGLFNKEYMKWAHSHGFLAENALSYQLTEANYKNYLSDYDYYRIWPLNSWARIWINDKLTLRYMLEDEKFRKFMPEYYFYTSTDGLRKLIDTPNEGQDYCAFFELLKKKKRFACKPCNGSGAQGFFKISFDGKQYYLNKKLRTKEGIVEFIDEHPNYLFTEYLYPNDYFQKISPQIHTLRLVVLNETGCKPMLVRGGYLRFATEAHGEANHLNSAEECLAQYDLVTEVDVDTGEFGNARAVFKNRIDDVEIHPDTGRPLCGKIPEWEQVKRCVYDISKRLFYEEYMGFDIGITDKGIKIMEINSHPGIKYMQIYRPFLKDPELKRYFHKKISVIDKLSKEEKKIRENIPR